MKDLSNETMIHVQKGEVSYLQFRRFLPYKELIHAYAVKGDKSSYNKENEQDYQKLCQALGIDRDQIIKIEEQIHSNQMEIVEEEKKQYTKIDGLLSKQQGKILCLRYADCIPLLFFDPIKKVVANIHSGWRGTVQQIGQKAVERLIQEFNCEAKDLLCGIGPSIGACHFEVGQEVNQMFIASFGEAVMDQAISMVEKRQGENKYWIDTVFLNRWMLEQVGLKSENIIQSGICTVCESDQIHSHRKMKEAAGRNTAMIGLK